MALTVCPDWAEEETEGVAVVVEAVEEEEEDEEVALGGLRLTNHGWWRYARASSAVQRLAGLMERRRERSSLSSGVKSAHGPRFRLPDA